MTREARWLDDEEQATWRAFLWASQLTHESLDRQLQRDSGMPHAYYMILVMLSEGTDRMRTMTELAQMTRFSPSRLSHAVSRLEDKGWVRRGRHRHCGRTTVATLTDEGLAELRMAAPGHVAQVRAAVFDPLTRKEQEQLRSISEKLLAGFKETEA